MNVPDPGEVSKVSKAIGRLLLRGGRFPWRHVIGHRQREQSRKIGGRRFTVQRPGGWTLDCWYTPPTESRSDEAPDTHTKPGASRSDAPGSPQPPMMPAPPRDTPPPRLPVVFSHGIFEFKERHFDRAAWLNARGHGVVLYDHRTHGRSGGDRITFGVEERDDLRAVIDEAQRLGYIHDRVVSMGFSLGGGTALQHAATDARVAGVVALAPFADFKSAVRTFRECFAPWLDENWVQRGMDAAATEAGFAVEQASALEAIPRITAPVMLVEAGRDPYLPPRFHTQELAKLRKGLPTTVCRIDEAHHISLVRKPWPKLDEAMAKFLDAVESKPGE